MRKFFKILTVALVCLSVATAHAQTCEEDKLLGIAKAQNFLDKALSDVARANEKHAVALTRIENARASELARIDSNTAACLNRVANAANEYIACIVAVIFEGNTSICGNGIDPTSENAACFAKANQQKDALNRKYTRQVSTENARHERQLIPLNARISRMQVRLEIANSVDCNIQPQQPSVPVSNSNSSVDLS